MVDNLTQIRTGKVKKHNELTEPPTLTQGLASNSEIRMRDEVLCPCDRWGILWDCHSVDTVQGDIYEDMIT